MLEENPRLTQRQSSVSPDWISLGAYVSVCINGDFVSGKSTQDR